MKQCKLMQKILKCQICEKQPIYCAICAILGSFNHYNVQLWYNNEL